MSDGLRVCRAEPPDGRTHIAPRHTARSLAGGTTLCGKRADPFDATSPDEPTCEECEAALTEGA